MTKAPKAKLNAMYFAIMLEALFEGPCTATEIARVTGFTRKTMVAILRTMYTRGVLHVAEWEKDIAGHNWVPVYGLGEGKDMARPGHMTQQEKNRRYAPRRAQRAVLRLAAGQAWGAQA